jgi:hypothetical protein
MAFCAYLRANYVHLTLFWRDFRGFSRLCTQRLRGRAGQSQLPAPGNLFVFISTELTENCARETVFTFNGMEVDEQPNWS